MSLVKSALTEQECSRDGSGNSYPRGSTNQKEWSSSEELPDARPMHSHKVHITTGKTEVTLQVLYAASQTCGIKKSRKYFCSLSSDHSKTAAPERRGDQKGGRSISWQKRTQLASSVGQHCGNTTLLYQHKESGLLLRDKSWLWKPQ